MTGRYRIASKMEWLDPKWYGTDDDMIAFGRRCRDTKNWRTGITLLAANVHDRIARRLPADESKNYYAKPEVWKEISEAYQEYFKHLPTDNFSRSRYAVFCYQCGKIAEAYAEFSIADDEIVGTPELPDQIMRQIMEYVEFQVKSGAVKKLLAR